MGFRFYGNLNMQKKRTTQILTIVYRTFKKWVSQASASKANKPVLTSQKEEDSFIMIVGGMKKRIAFQANVEEQTCS
jgi:hypothetical protein